MKTIAYAVTLVEALLVCPDCIYLPMASISIARKALVLVDVELVEELESLVVVEELVVAPDVLDESEELLVPLTLWEESMPMGGGGGGGADVLFCMLET